MFGFFHFTFCNLFYCFIRFRCFWGFGSILFSLRDIVGSFGQCVCTTTLMLRSWEADLYLFAGVRISDSRPNGPGLRPWIGPSRCSIFKVTSWLLVSRWRLPEPPLPQILQKDLKAKRASASLVRTKDMLPCCVVSFWYSTFRDKSYISKVLDILQQSFFCKGEFWNTFFLSSFISLSC